MKRILTFMALLWLCGFSPHAHAQPGISQQVKAVQYYFDQDPGLGIISGNGAVLALTPQDTIDQLLNITVPNPMSPGVHQLVVRVQDASGNWSLMQRRAFFVGGAQPMVPPTLAGNIVAIQYYFDQDPGLGIPGNGAVIAVSPQDTVDQLLNIAVPNPMSPGVHLLVVRVQGANGHWSLVQRKVFLVGSAQAIIPPALAGDVTAIQYFYNQDPGFGVAGNGAIISVPADSAILENLSIVLPTNLPFGVNQLYVRVKDQFGHWSRVERRAFYLSDGTVLGSPEVSSQLTALEYYYDNDPGVGQANHIDVSPPDTLGGLFSIATPCLSTGQHILYVRARNAERDWSLVDTDTLHILSGSNISTSVLAAGALEICQGDSVELTFTEVDGTAYEWLFNGSPILGADTNFIQARQAGIYQVKTICNGAFTVSDSVDVDFLPITRYYADKDNDGFGDATDTVSDCTQPIGFVTDSTDCNDLDSLINPAAAEICDGVDNNCNGQVDEDLFVSDSSSIAICEGDSILIGGVFRFEGGTYVDTIFFSNQCDSVLTVQLTVNPVDTTQQTATTTDPNGAGVFTTTLTNQFGCDSLVITTVTFSPDPCADPDTTFISSVSCDSAQAGVNYQTLTGSDGCDSVLVTTTVFDPGSTTPLPAVAICQGQGALIFGNPENMAGTYYDTLVNQNGCDSILTVTLNVLSPTSGAVSMSICDGESVLLGGALRTTAGVYIDTLTGSNGCDSILTTTLSIKPTYSVTVTDSICPGDSLFLGGAYQTMAGTYTDILAAANGCDSVITTMLSLRTDSGCVQDTAMQSCLTVVSDARWMQSSVTSPVNLSGYWPGASGLPGVGTYNLPVNIGQPYGYPSINQIEGTDVISTTHSVTYFRKEFSLTKASDLDVRLLITVDDQADIYLNGHRVALITRFGRPNFKFPAHDLKYFSNGTEINGFLGGDMYDMTSTADMDTLLNDGVNELILAVRNLGKSSDRGGFSFRMDINCADNIITRKVAEVSAEEANGLYIFPNPVGELLTIHSELAISSVRLFDLSGKLLFSHAYDSAKEVVIEMDHLSKGVYLIEVNEMGYEVSTVRIVKM